MFTLQDLLKKPVLDKGKQYIGIEIGKGLTSKIIQLRTKDISNMSTGETASHVLALAWNGEDWYIYESHLKLGGVAKYPLSEFLEYWPEKNITFKEYPLNVKILEHFERFNPGYGFFDIASKIPIIDGLIENNNGKGLICSEYIALCTEGEICKDFNLPEQAIVPAHYQVWGKLK